jgi:hypothetical protein
MRLTMRLRLAVLAVAVLAGASGLIATAASARAGLAAASPPSVERFSLNGYVLDAAYDRGRNTGNTFRQTYKATTVHGVPIKGPYVGQKFPVERYVAMSIGDHQLFVAWLDKKTHALLDVFVMNFDTHVIYDYAPGSLKPESTGTFTVVKEGSTPVP